MIFYGTVQIVCSNICGHLKPEAFCTTQENSRSSVVGGKFKWSVYQVYPEIRFEADLNSLWRNEYPSE